MSASPWFVYMLATSDGMLYTGITTDIERRWHEHSSGKGGAKFFRTRKPARLVYLEDQPDRSGASKREAIIKKLTPAAKRELIAGISTPCRLRVEAKAAQLVLGATAQPD